jgi:hypothetical protein
MQGKCLADAIVICLPKAAEVRSPEWASASLHKCERGCNWLGEFAPDTKRILKRKHKNHECLFLPTIVFTLIGLPFSVTSISIRDVVKDATCNARALARVEAHACSLRKAGQDRLWES